jgi:indole-3-glycerol phosphate synthase
MSVLEKIVEWKHSEVERLRREPGIEVLSEAARGTTAPMDFRAGLGTGIAVIAEVKRRSPSRGEIFAGDVSGLARSYREHGARAVSVLTDERFFGGTADDLKIAKHASGLPVLRKDFILDPLQVYESRALGADAILLIAAILDAGRLRELSALAADLDMASLVEVHSTNELELVLGLGADLVGINNRDLESFEVRLETAIDLAPLIPPAVTAVAESGIREARDVARLVRAGFRAFLVGEALVASDDPGRSLRKLVSGAETALREEVVPRDRQDLRHHPSR